MLDSLLVFLIKSLSILGHQQLIRQKSAIKYFVDPCGNTQAQFSCLYPRLEYLDIELVTEEFLQLCTSYVELCCV